MGGGVKGGREIANIHESLRFLARINYAAYKDETGGRQERKIPYRHRSCLK